MPLLAELAGYRWERAYKHGAPTALNLGRQTASISTV